HKPRPQLDRKLCSLQPKRRRRRNPKKRRPQRAWKSAVRLEIVLETAIGTRQSKSVSARPAFVFNLQCRSPRSRFAILGGRRGRNSNEWSAFHRSGLTKCHIWHVARQTFQRKFLSQRKERIT